MTDRAISVINRSFWFGVGAFRNVTQSRTAQECLDKAEAVREKPAHHTAPCEVWPRPRGGPQRRNDALTLVFPRSSEPGRQTEVVVTENL